MQQHSTEVVGSWPIRTQIKNMQPVLSAGKHETDVKRGKTGNGCQARENIQPVPSAGKVMGAS